MLLQINVKQGVNTELFKDSLLDSSPFYGKDKLLNYDVVLNTITLDINNVTKRLSMWLDLNRDLIARWSIINEGTTEATLTLSEAKKALAAFIGNMQVHDLGTGRLEQVLDVIHKLEIKEKTSK